MKHISLFSGCGGFDLAAQWIGWDNVVSCELNPYLRRVLSYYWPKSYHHDDVKTLTYKTINEEVKKRFGADWHTDDVILSGGFPCQPYSVAGKRLGKADDRHLWPEMFRIIQESHPSWVVGENVRGIVDWNDGLVFDEVQADLESEGYEVVPFILPAASVNGPHKRYRVFFIAYLNSFRRKSRLRMGEDVQYGNVSFGGAGTSVIKEGFASYTDGIERQEGWEYKKESEKTERHISSCSTWDFGGNWQNFPTQSPIWSGDDGLSAELDGITVSKWRKLAIEAYGNAIVPQVAYNIFKTIDLYVKTVEQ